MPDHLHLLVVGRAADASLPEFIRGFKQRLGYWYRGETGRPLWQSGYFDRVLREEEDTIGVCAYVLGNPVRKGLAKTIGEYAYAGSEVYGIEEIVDRLTSQG